jgi:hypothetical protein
LDRRPWRPTVGAPRPVVGSRDGIEPFGRRSRTLDIALHPERYAKPDRLREIRGFFGLGALLVFAALTVVLYDVYLTMAAA